MIDAYGRPQRLFLLGGTSEIGLAFVCRLAQSKSLIEVCLAGRDFIRLKSVRDSLSERFPHVTFNVVILDLTESKDLAQTVKDEFKLREFDLAVLSAGLLPNNIEAISNTEICMETAKVNFTGALEVASSLINCMARQGHGTVLNVSSIAIVRPRRDMAIYGASKAGLDYWIESMSKAMRDKGVKLINVRPGMVRTRMSQGIREAPFTCNPDDVAKIALSKMHKSKGTIWVPKEMGMVSIVMKFIPEIIFKRLTQR